MAKMIRVNAVYGRGNPIPIGKTKFYKDFVLKDESDPFIPGTNPERCRARSLGPQRRLGSEFRAPLGRPRSRPSTSDHPSEMSRNVGATPIAAFRSQARDRAPRARPPLERRPAAVRTVSN